MADPGRPEAGGSRIREPLLLGESTLVSPWGDPPSDARPSFHSIMTRLHGRATGRRWAFLCMFGIDGRSRPARAERLTLALFDLGRGEYATTTEHDRRRPLRRRRAARAAASLEGFGLSFEGSCGESFWRARETVEDLSAPLASELHCAGVGADGRIMRLDLELSARTPPLPLGRGGAFGCFQCGVRASGRFEWGGEHEEVDGDCGWITRQWAPTAFRAHGRLRPDRCRYESCRAQLDDGTAIGLWMCFDGQRADRIIPPCIATATSPNGELVSTSDFRLERRSFVRDPPIASPQDPLERAKYFAGGYRLSVPAWNLELVSEPLVAAPAHAFLADLWSGPTRLTGTLDGMPVNGAGFDERTRVYRRDFEIVDVLRETFRQLPAAAWAADGLDGATLADLAWEVDGFIADGDQQAAIRFLNEHVRPSIEALAEPHRDHLRTIVDDAADALLRWWIRP